MNNFFQPKSVAIIGASSNPRKLGFQVTDNLKKAGFSGKILPINLDDKKILGFAAHQSVLDIHRPIDFATIIVPREVVPQVLKQCVIKEIPNVLIISAGFAEKDAKGKKLQKELTQITKGQKTKIIGPNCLGIINTEIGLNLTFAASRVNKGNIGLILQSGAIGAAILDWAQANELGISKFISLGNKISISEIESLKLMGDDPQTKVIAMYIEELDKPHEFFLLSRRIARDKPIIVLKGGKTEEGAKAASSHTAALTTDIALNRTLFSQANLIFAETYEELLNLLMLFEEKVGSVDQNTLAILTNAGGPGILAADSAAKVGLKLPNLSNHATEELKKTLDGFATLENPFDLGGDASPHRYRTALKTILSSKNFAATLIIVTPQSMTEPLKLAKTIGEFRHAHMPILSSFLGGSKIERARKFLIKKRLPSFDDPAEAITELAKVYQYHRRKEMPQKEIKFGNTGYTTHNPQTLIKHFQIPFADSEIVNSEAELMAAAERIDFPLVYKTAREIKSKEKSGKVGLNIVDNQELRRAVRAIGFPGIVQQMIISPYELILGAKRDPNFGIALLLGQGGIYAEENPNISYKILPLTDLDLTEMIEQADIYPILKEMGLVTQVKSTILKLTSAILSDSSIKEIELNPLKLLKGKLIGVDINITR